MLTEEKSFFYVYNFQEIIDYRIMINGIERVKK